MFGFGKRKEPLVIGAPLAGEAVPLSEVADATFNSGILGDGAAIRPTVGRVVSPVDGTVQTIFPTGHAVSIVAANGAELLIHIGLDTVKLEGRHYTKHVENGAKVKKGDLLIECDLEGIRSEGYDTITPVVVCNTADFEAVKGQTGKTVNALDPLIELVQKK